MLLGTNDLSDNLHEHLLDAILERRLALLGHDFVRAVWRPDEHLSAQPPTPSISASARGTERARAARCSGRAVSWRVCRAGGGDVRTHRVIDQHAVQVALLIPLAGHRLGELVKDFLRANVDLGVGLFSLAGCLIDGALHAFFDNLEVHIGQLGRLEIRCSRRRC